MEKPKVSLVIITYNEEKNIERCIRSVPFASEVIVLDSQSTDNTCALAEREGARVVIESFRGYHQQKVRATELASYDWVLSLDADEALGEELRQEIEDIISRPIHVDAFEMPRLSYHMGRWIHHGGWYPDAQIRLFNRTRCRWREGHVHERVEAERVMRLSHPIKHWVFDNLSDQVATNNEYSSLGAKDLLERGKRFSLLKLIFKPVSKFLETYIWKRGFLDGLPGFVISVGAAYSVFLKFAKLWELERQQALSLHQPQNSVSSGQGTSS